MKKMISGFNESLIELMPLVVALRGSEYYIVDGQQRWHAAKLTGIKTLKCNVFLSSGIEHEAELFKDLNYTKKFAPYDTWNAACIGREEDAVAIQTALDKHNITCSNSYNRQARKWNECNAINSLKNCYQSMKAINVQYFEDIIDILAANGKIGAFFMEPIDSLALFYSKHHDIINKAHAIKRFSKCNFKDLRDEACGRAKGTRYYVKDRMCESLIRIYNSHLTNKSYIMKIPESTLKA